MTAVTEQELIDQYSQINIPGYTLKGLLGTGGMAQVFLAHQHSFDQQVALKIMDSALSKEPYFSKSFIREARIMRRLRHDHVVTVYDIGEHNDRNYLSMEYYPGGDLKQVMGAPISVEVVHSIIVQIASAIAHAHQFGFIHRDIKPANILFRANGSAVITDFGIARTFNVEDTIAMDGMTMGTPTYMSPEATLGEAISGSADIYSLGILFYELLVGKPPYQGETPISIAVKHVKEPLPILPPEYSHYQDFLDSMLAKIPSERLQTGEEVINTLQTIPVDNSLVCGDKSNPDQTLVLSHIKSQHLKALQMGSPIGDTSHTFAKRTRLFTVPFQRNELFQGREKELEQLKELALSDDEHAKVVAISGLGGMGKSQLASEFAYRHEKDFIGGIFWLDFSDATSALMDYTHCGAPQNLGLFDNNTPLTMEQQADEVRQVFEQDIPRLLIFDNCEDPLLLKQFQPKRGRATVLITSRYQDWSDEVKQVSINTLTREESAKLLSSYRKDPYANPAILDAVAEQLGDFPLALHLAGSFLKSYSSKTLEWYIDKIGASTLLSHPSLTGRKREKMMSPTHHEENVAQTFLLGFQQLGDDEIDQLAKKLLFLICCVAPGEPIPLAFLEMLAEPKDDDELDDFELDFEDAVHRLVNIGLVSRRRKSLMIHRLVHNFCNTQATEEGVNYLTEIATNINIRCRSIQEIKDPRVVAPWATHLRYLADVLVEQKNPQAAEACHHLGTYYLAAGLFTSALEYNNIALELRQNQTPPDNLAIGQSLRALGLCNNRLGKYTQAIDYHLQAHKIYAEKYPDGHAEVAALWSELGEFHRILGRYAEALHYAEQSLAWNLEHYGAEDKSVAREWRSLGTIHQQLGNSAKAIEYHEKSMASYQKLITGDNPAIVTSWSDLGRAYELAGDYAKAMDYYTQALPMALKIFGEQHPQVGILYNDMGQCLTKHGDLEQAITNIEKGLEIERKVFGNGHPYVAIFMINLARAQKLKGDIDAAKANTLKLIELGLAAVGPNHPYLGIAWTELGSIHFILQEYNEAVECFEKTLTVYINNFKENNRWTAPVLRDLGKTWEKLNQPEKALECYQKSLLVYRLAVGAETAPEIQEGTTVEAKTVTALKLLKEYEGAVKDFPNKIW